MAHFDNTFSDLFKLAFNDLSESKYPPYNMIDNGNFSYTIEVAVAGFNKNEIDITVERNILTISSQTKHEDESNVKYIHRGLAKRDFKLQFRLRPYTEIDDAIVENGLLYINLKTVIPEEHQPRKININ